MYQLLQNKSDHELATIGELILEFANEMQKSQEVHEQEEALKNALQGCLNVDQYLDVEDSLNAFIEGLEKDYYNKGFWAALQIAKLTKPNN